VPKFLGVQTVYTIDARRIEGTQEEKLEQLDEAIQELLDIKVLECGAGRPNLRFIAAPRPKPHGGAMVAVILGLLILLVWILGVHPGAW
jgi:hypothetical protein